MIANTNHYSVPVTFHDVTDPEWNPPGESGDSMGYLDIVNLAIKVRVDAAPAMKADTVLHELLHLAAMAWGIDSESKYSEEQFISGLTAGVKQLLTQDNDAVLSYLGMNL